MPAQWHIDRMAAQVPGVASLVCEEGQHACTFTLRNLNNGETTTVTACIPNAAETVCDTLDILTAAGFTPNDWSAECPGA